MDLSDNAGPLPGLLTVRGQCPALDIEYFVFPVPFLVLGDWGKEETFRIHHSLLSKQPCIFRQFQKEAGGSKSYNSHLAA